jgi:hypothetical protein
MSFCVRGLRIWGFGYLGCLESVDMEDVRSFWTLKKSNSSTEAKKLQCEEIWRVFLKSEDDG